VALGSTSSAQGEEPAVNHTLLYGDSLPDDRGYTPDHVWVTRAETRDRVRVGIAPGFAPTLRGTPVALHLPAMGTRIRVAAPCASVETSKAHLDVFAPCDGSITAHNPDACADACFDARWSTTWLWEMTVTTLDHLWAAERYLALLQRAHAHGGLR
jgi:glycine cleavage system H protein